jgi:4a-hydroxytetrahydrobiopterin dehydratase
MAEHPMDRVSDRELENLLQGRLRQWNKAGSALERTFHFHDFATALGFVNAVGGKAEMLGHHPDIDIRYNQVRLSLSSHDAGGITQRDLLLADHIEEIAPPFETRKTA